MGLAFISATSIHYLGVLAGPTQLRRIGVAVYYRAHLESAPVVTRSRIAMWSIRGTLRKASSQRHIVGCGCVVFVVAIVSFIGVRCVIPKNRYLTNMVYAHRAFIQQRIETIFGHDDATFVWKDMQRPSTPTGPRWCFRCGEILGTTTVSIVIGIWKARAVQMDTCD